MDCEVIKKMIPRYQTGELGNEQIQDFLNHLRDCPACSRELKAYEEVWHLLGKWEDQDPDPAYLSRFWTNVSLQTPWHERIWERFRPVIFSPRFVPVLTSVVVAIVLLQMTLAQLKIRETEKIMTSLNTEEIEFIEDMDISQNLDVLSDLDFLQDYDIITGGIS